MIRFLASVPSDPQQECHHLITAVDISYRRGHTRNFPPLYLQYFPHHDDLVLLLVLLASISGYPDRLTRGRTLGGSLTVRRLRRTPAFKFTSKHWQTSLKYDLLRWLLPLRRCVHFLVHTIGGMACRFGPQILKSVQAD